MTEVLDLKMRRRDCTLAMLRRCYATLFLQDESDADSPLQASKKVLLSDEDLVDEDTSWVCTVFSRLWNKDPSIHSIVTSCSLL